MILREQIIQKLLKVTNSTYGVPGGVDDQDLPIRVLDDFEDIVEPDAYDQWVHTMSIIIAEANAVETSDPDKMRQDAHKNINQILSSIYDDETLGGLAEHIELTGVNVQTEAARFTFVQLSLTVTYHSQRGDLATN